VITEARQVAQRIVAESPDLGRYPGLARLVSDSRAEFLEKV